MDELPIRIMGIDPGTRVAGWGVVERSGHDFVAVAAGVVRAAETLPIGERLRIIFAGLRDALGAHAVEVVAVEEAFYGKNVRSAIRLGEGRAVALLAAALAGATVVELAAALVKKAVVGHGAATKEQVRSALEATLSGGVQAARDLPFDATDALAVAVAAHARAGAPPSRRRRRGGRFTSSDLLELGFELGPEDPQAPLRAGLS
jgi:crossover junction endodeoxyribonuclease RuvC